jgi:holo-[acyl-carrier protein] synthase
VRRGGKAGQLREEAARMIFGIGVDLIEIERVETNLREHGERFEEKVFTPTERGYCRRMPLPAQHYAARFAAKEAFLKALGTGWARGITWQDVGIENLPSGMPRLVITGRALELAREYGVTQMHVTLSHSRGHAVAVVVLEKADAGRE